MIDIRELRHNNFFNYKGSPCRVFIDDYGNIMMDEGMTMAKVTKVELNNLSPIFLTEEWLLKFGLPKKLNSYGDSYEYFIKGIGNGVLNQDGFVIYFNNEYQLSPIQYVHQIQNLYFALTGEELTPIS